MVYPPQGSRGGPRIKGTVFIDPPEIRRNETINVDAEVLGLLTSDTIYVQCQSDLENGLVCISSYCPTNNTLRIRITNTSDRLIDGILRPWAYQVY